MALLGAVALVFVVYALPPYLTLDPAQARLQPFPPFAAYYPLLVTHIFLGSVALIAASLQVWPWLRRTHPRVHRITGRIYVSAVLPASICVLIIAPMGIHGAKNKSIPRRRPTDRRTSSSVSFEKSVGQAEARWTYSHIPALVHFPRDQYRGPQTQQTEVN